MKNITIGADIEFFLANKRGLKSAIGIIPGTKEKKYILQSGAGLHVDNVSLEIAFEPFNSFEDFNNHIEKSLDEVKEMIYPLTLSKKSSSLFPVSELNHADAWLFGCDPDFNAWSEDINIFDRMRCEETLRSNGGHIHIGIESLAKDLGSHCNFVRNLDSSLGIWSLKYDKDRKRRKIYGQAGAFRPKPYGIEYRVLSNFWIFENDMRKEVWNRSMEVGKKYLKGELDNNISPFVIESINKG